MPKIHIENLDITIDAQSGLNLLNNFIVNNVAIHTVCGGRGMCGCCRVKVLSGGDGMSKLKQEEIVRLGEELIESGWRLSCQSYCVRDISVYLPVAKDLPDICSRGN